MTCVTAIASPDRTSAAEENRGIRPPRVYGRTTPRTISQRVSPRPTAPSLMSVGTCRKRSRLIEAVIGTIMIASTRTAVNIVLPEIGLVAKNGVQPRMSFSHGPNWSCTTGPRMMMPQRPSTTLGIAASISTSEPTTPRTPARRKLAQIEADRDRHGRGEQDGQAGDVERRNEEIECTELVCDGVPGLVPDEAEPEGGDCLT